jgi:catechol 2,3-dioxygenase
MATRLAYPSRVSTSSDGRRCAHVRSREGTARSARRARFRRAERFVPLGSLVASEGLTRWYGRERGLPPARTLPDVSDSIDPRVEIGHVHLKVADLDRALGFYRDVLGFDVTQRLGDSAAFLSAGGYHHHLGLNTWESRGGSPPPPGTTGLYHVAIRYPDRSTLGNAVRRLVDNRVPVEGATDHGVSEAIYLRDPDGNGIELYRDRPREEWPRAEGEEGVAMFNAPLDLEALLAEALP